MVLKRFGGTENLEIEEVAQPEPAAGEVLVRIKGIGIDRIDLKTREGGGQARVEESRKPMILGWDLSGVVAAVGAGVTEFKEGDEVFGTVGFPGPGCSYAEFAAVKADELARKPANISHAEAAAATQSPLTAWQALDAGHVGKGDRVLIHGGAGGVGNYAVQIARHLGCHVIATAAGTDTDFVKGLGADEVIDYKTQRFDDLLQDVDFVLDTIGGENFVRSLKVLAPGGTIVLLPSNKKEEADKAAAEHHVENYKALLMHSSGEDMRRIAELLAQGNLKVHVDRTFAFDEIPQAHELLENGKVKGKIAIVL